jgi:ERCC4-type nuclease
MAAVQVHLSIDHREAALWAALQMRAEDANADAGLPGWSMECAALDLGDACLKVDDIEMVLFERKTAADLAASLKDGRYKEQKQRVLAHWPAARVVYVLEGAPSLTDWSRRSDQSFHGLSGNVLTGMILNTLFRDGIHVLWTRTVHDTAALIWSVAEKVVANPWRFGARASGGDGASVDAMVPAAPIPSLKRRRMENVTPQTCWIDQLCQIPHISSKLAAAVTKIFPTPRALAAALEAAGEQRGSILSAIPGIGAKKAASIVMFMGFA